MFTLPFLFSFAHWQYSDIAAYLWMRKSSECLYVDTSAPRTSGSNASFCMCVCVAQTWNQFNPISEFDCLLVKSATSTCLITFMISLFFFSLSLCLQLENPSADKYTQKISFQRLLIGSLWIQRNWFYKYTCRLNIHFIHFPIQKYFYPGYSYCL